MKFIPDPDIHPRQWPEAVIYAATIFGEARGESIKAKAAVAHIVKNRVLSPVKWWGSTFRDVCLAYRQFSSWHDHNRDAMLYPLKESPDTWLDCLSIANLMIRSDILADPTHGATHYHDRSIGRPSGWDRMIRTATIGPFEFYR